MQLKWVKGKIKTEVSIPAHRDRGYYHLSHVQTAYAPTGFSNPWSFDTRKPFTLRFFMLLSHLMSTPLLNPKELAPSYSPNNSLKYLPSQCRSSKFSSDILLLLINRHQRVTKKYEGLIAILELVFTSLCS